jgi:hypothetical protein
MSEPGNPFLGHGSRSPATAKEIKEFLVTPMSLAELARLVLHELTPNIGHVKGWK